MKLNEECLLQAQVRREFLERASINMRRPKTTGLNLWTDCQERKLARYIFLSIHQKNH